MALVQQHPVMGYEILKDIDSPWPLADIVLQHHENMDGSGYPRGLKGDEISLEARILRVCDIVEAMSSHRVFRASHPMSEVFNEIRGMAGQELDAEVVRVCLDLFQRHGYKLPA
jgi:HD-GYP domain-containing protein (c-di-GMP phosphodiesterase class II)